MMPTQEQKAAVLAMVAAIRDAIQALQEVPAGHLYAQVMGHMDLNTFEAIVGLLVAAGQVRRDGSHLLTWIGPRK